MPSGQSVVNNSEEPEAGLRLVIGVDGAGACEYALNLARRLDFHPPQHYVLVNALEPVLPVNTFPSLGYAEELGLDMRGREAAGMAILRKACEEVSDRDPKAEELQAHGAPAEVLIRVAREERADLVVVGHNRRDLVDNFLLGSVARTLLRECPQHLLVARPPPVRIDRLIAVIATDASPESERCIEAFLHLAPKGLHKVFVLTVNEFDSGAATMLVRGQPSLKEKAERWIEEGLEADALTLSRRLENAGFDATPLVVKGGDTASAITLACDENGASLLVLAAHSHSYWERFFNGSVSEEIFEKDSRSLLVLRT